MFGMPGMKPDPEAAEHEEDRIRHVEHARRGDENGDREQQPGEHQLRVRARCGHLVSFLAGLG